MKAKVEFDNSTGTFYDGECQNGAWWVVDGGHKFRRRIPSPSVQPSPLFLPESEERHSLVCID